MEILMLVGFLLLIGIQRRTKPLLREIATVAMLVLSMGLLFDYQLKLYICNNDQENIAKAIVAAAPDDDLAWLRQAARNYREKANNPNPPKIAYRSFFDAVDREENMPTIDYD